MNDQEDYITEIPEYAPISPGEFESGLRPYFRLFCAGSIGLFVLLLIPSVILLLIGFGIFGSRTSSDGWGQMFGLLYGLILLIMTLASAGCNLLLISYRRKAAFAPARPWPILLAAGVSLVIGAALTGLMFGFFGPHLALIAAAVLSFLHGAFGMFIVLRPLRPDDGNRGDIDNKASDVDNIPEEQEESNGRIE